MLSAWYGIGSAIETFRRRHGPAGMQELVDMAHRWPFARVVWENAQASLGKTDLHIVRVYAGLVQAPTVRDRIFRKINAEYTQTVRGVLDVTRCRTLLEYQPVLKHSILLRNPYVDPLHILQVRAISELRRAHSGQARWSPRQKAEVSKRWLELVRLTIHGIAYGMKSTG